MEERGFGLSPCQVRLLLRRVCMQGSGGIFWSSELSAVLEHVSAVAVRSEGCRVERCREGVGEGVWKVSESPG